ncbi:MAG: hypothetical protein L0L86_08430 [Lactococcus lactis]|nr:hypothetical protein [Lactococcus lactis]
MKKKYVYIVMLILVIVSLILVIFDKQPKGLNILTLLGMAALILTDEKGGLK